MGWMELGKCQLPARGEYFQLWKLRFVNIKLTYLWKTNSFQFSEVKFLTTLFLVGCEAKCTGGEREGHHDSGWRIFIVLSLSFVFASVICLYFVVSLLRFACVVFLLIKGG